MFLIMFSLFLVFGILAQVSLVLAEDENKGNSDVSEDLKDNSQITEVKNDDTKVTSKEITTGNGCKIVIEKEEITTQSGKKITVNKRQMECEDGTRKEVKIKIENRTEDGKVRERIRYEREGREFNVSADEGIKFEEQSNGTDYKLKARLRNGNFTEIKIMPDRASAIAIERLKALNFTVVLKEVSENNVAKVVYDIETNKNGRFLGIIKMKVKVDGQIDPTTGEYLGTGKPWWAFLVAGEDSDQTIETETVN